MDKKRVDELTIQQANGEKRPFRIITGYDVPQAEKTFVLVEYLDVESDSTEKLQAERDEAVQDVKELWNVSSQLATARARTRQVIEIAKRFRTANRVSFKMYETADAERDALRAQVEALKAEREAVDDVIALVEMMPEAHDTTSDLFVALAVLQIRQKQTDGQPTGTPLDDATRQIDGLTPLSADDAAAHDPNAG